METKDLRKDECRFEVGKTYEHYEGERKIYEFVCTERSGDVVTLVDAKMNKTVKGEVSTAGVGVNGYNECLRIGETSSGRCWIVEYVVAHDFYTEMRKRTGKEGRK